MTIVNRITAVRPGGSIKPPTTVKLAPLSKVPRVKGGATAPTMGAGAFRAFDLQGADFTHDDFKIGGRLHNLMDAKRIEAFELLKKSPNDATGIRVYHGVTDLLNYISSERTRLKNELDDKIYNNKKR